MLWPFGCYLTRAIWLVLSDLVQIISAWAFVARCRALAFRVVFHTRNLIFTFKPTFYFWTTPAFAFIARSRALALRVLSRTWFCDILLSSFFNHENCAWFWNLVLGLWYLTFQIPSQFIQCFCCLWAFRTLRLQFFSSIHNFRWQVNFFTFLYYLQPLAQREGAFHCDILAHWLLEEKKKMDCILLTVYFIGLA